MILHSDALLQQSVICCEVWHDFFTKILPEPNQSNEIIELSSRVFSDMIFESGSGLGNVGLLNTMVHSPDNAAPRKVSHHPS
jgi:hypothetical protein